MIELIAKALYETDSQALTELFPDSKHEPWEELEGKQCYYGAASCILECLAAQGYMIIKPTYRTDWGPNPSKNGKV
jgi:hypothetical protein